MNTAWCIALPAPSQCWSVLWINWHAFPQIALKHWSRSLKYRKSPQGKTLHRNIWLSCVVSMFWDPAILTNHKCNTTSTLLCFTMCSSFWSVSTIIRHPLCFSYSVPVNHMTKFHTNKCIISWIFLENCLHVKHKFLSLVSFSNKTF